jgi:hypothetical protein
MSFIAIVFHANFDILKCLMHELSKKPGNIFRQVNSLMHELFKNGSPCEFSYALAFGFSDNIFRERFQSHSDKIVYQVFYDTMHIYVKVRKRQNGLPQSALEALY